MLGAGDGGTRGIGPTARAAAQAMALALAQGKTATDNVHWIVLYRHVSVTVMTVPREGFGFRRTNLSSWKLEGTQSQHGVNQAPMST